MAEGIAEQGAGEPVDVPLVPHWPLRIGIMSHDAEQQVEHPPASPSPSFALPGNQDTTAAVWDMRNLSHPLARLAGHMGAIRSLRFSSDGRFLAMSEPADFVHIYDISAGFKRVRGGGDFQGKKEGGPGGQGQAWVHGGVGA